MTFIQKINTAWLQQNSLLCIGLDPDKGKIPPEFLEQPDGIFQFLKEIVDATHDLVCCYKPQIAYFAAQAAENQLTKIIQYIKAHYSHIPVILDAKRGDIGSTSNMYAQEAFVRYDVDAVTINPYMGYDSAQPFLKFEDRGVILLCRTSNDGAADIQDLEISGGPLYEHVARLIADKWNYNKNCLLVVGATWPEQMARLRGIVGEMPFLVPGVGAQGGDVEKLVKAGQTANGTGLIISSSRGVLYASRERDFAEAARREALLLRNLINKHRDHCHLLTRSY